MRRLGEVAACVPRVAEQREADHDLEVFAAARDRERDLLIDAVVEPAHGLVPSGAELKDVIDLLRRDQISVVFSEETFPQPLLDVVREQGNARVYLLSHIASGEYTAEKFEREMQGNVDAMVKALVTDPAMPAK